MRGEEERRGGGGGEGNRAKTLGEAQVGKECNTVKERER